MELAEDDDPNAFELWEENWEVALLFMRLQTQWQIVAGFGFVRFTGLDWGGVEHKMNLLNVKRRDRPRLTEQLEVMEAAALKEVNRKADG